MITGFKVAGSIIITVAGSITLTFQQKPFPFNTGEDIKEDRIGREVATEPKVTHKDMVWIPGGEFEQGADNEQAFEDKYPKHRVEVDGFWMDDTEVTNAQFAEFVNATGVGIRREGRVKE
jgi:formylglycine-generating enzyme required for sulfatase activity